jgi:circadian clock protein KaiB
MTDDPPKDSAEEFEKALARMKDGEYTLRLYITGMTPRSARAIANLREICETHLKGRYQLEVIDIYQQPEKARDGQVLATPTLIKLLPQPLRRIVGDLSRKERILLGLDLLPAEEDLPGKE